MHDWRKILHMARKRTYREPKQQMGVSIHSDLADMTAALAKKSNRPKSYIVELALAAWRTADCWRKSRLPEGIESI